MNSPNQDEPRNFLADLAPSPQERDPMRDARKDAPQPPKRFYKSATTGAVSGGFAVLLDGRTVRTPARATLLAPSEALAEAIAAEWANQGERIEPATMPLTRLANSAIDGVAARMSEVEADALKFATADLICYRAGEPSALVSAQSAAWNPYVTLAREAFGARLILAEGVMFVEQPPSALAALQEAVRGIVGTGQAAPFRLTALHSMTTLTGSFVVALAVVAGLVEMEAAWSAVHVDEDFEMSQWGEDADAMRRRELRRKEMAAAALLARLSVG